MREFNEAEKERINKFRLCRSLVKQNPKKYRLEFYRIPIAPWFGIWFNFYEDGRQIYSSDAWTKYE